MVNDSLRSLLQRRRTELDIGTVSEMVHFVNMADAAQSAAPVWNKNTAQCICNHIKKNTAMGNSIACQIEQYIQQMCYGC